MEIYWINLTAASHCAEGDNAAAAGRSGEVAAALASVPDRSVTAGEASLRPAAFVSHLVRQLALAAAARGGGGVGGSGGSAPAGGVCSNSGGSSSIAAPGSACGGGQHERLEGAGAAPAASFAADVMARLCRRGHAQPVAAALWALFSGSDEAPPHQNPGRPQGQQQGSMPGSSASGEAASSGAPPASAMAAAAADLIAAIKDAAALEKLLEALLRLLDGSGQPHMQPISGLAAAASSAAGGGSGNSSGGAAGNLAGVAPSGVGPPKSFGPVAAALADLILRCDIGAPVMHEFDGPVPNSNLVVHMHCAIFLAGSRRTFRVTTALHILKFCLSPTEGDRYISLLQAPVGLPGRALPARRSAAACAVAAAAGAALRHFAAGACAGGDGRRRQQRRRIRDQNAEQRQLCSSRRDCSAAGGSAASGAAVGRQGRAHQAAADAPGGFNRIDIGIPAFTVDDLQGCTGRPAEQTLAAVMMTPVN